MSTGPAPVVHPATPWALGLGLVGVLGAVVVLPLLVAPFAWYLGARARREVEREPHRWTGHHQAGVAMVLGIIGTGLLALLVLALVVTAGLATLGVLAPSGYDG